MVPLVNWMLIGSVLQQRGATCARRGIVRVAGLDQVGKAHASRLHPAPSPANVDPDRVLQVRQRLRPSGPWLACAHSGASSRSMPR